MVASARRVRKSKRRKLTTDLVKWGEVDNYGVLSELDNVVTPPIMGENSEGSVGHLTEVEKESEVRNPFSLLKESNVDTRYMDRKKRVCKRSRAEMVGHKERLVSEFFQPIAINQPKPNASQNTDCGVSNCFPCSNLVNDFEGFTCCYGNSRGTLGTSVLQPERHVEGEYLPLEEIIKLIKHFWTNQSDSDKLDPDITWIKQQHTEEENFGRDVGGQVRCGS